MGYSACYLDNKTYGAEDLNRTVSQLVTEGVADPFTDGLPYNVTKLNDVIYSVSSDGVVPDGVSTLKCTINTSAKTVTIAPGTAFFQNGSVITVDVDGVVLPYTAGTVNYVYVQADESLNVISPACSTTAPSGDYVMLAEISAAGVLTDKRKYAQGKVPGYQSNAGTCMKVSDTVTLVRESNQNYTGQYTLYLGTNDFYLVSYEKVTVGDIYEGVISHYHVDTGTAVSNIWRRIRSSGNYNGRTTDTFVFDFVDEYTTQATVTRQGNNLIFDITRNYAYFAIPGSGVTQVPLSFELMVL